MDIDSNWVIREIANKRMSPYKCAILAGTLVLLSNLNVDLSDFYWISLAYIICIQYIFMISIVSYIYNCLRNVVSSRTLKFNKKQYIVKLNDIDVIKDDIKRLEIRKLSLDELYEYGFGVKALVIKGTNRDKVFYVRGMSRKYVGFSINNLN